MDKRTIWSRKIYSGRGIAEKLLKAHIFDAEEVGNAIRDNFPEESKYSIIFEGYSLWRETNYKLLKEIYEKYDGDIIVPMTLTLSVSYEEIIKRLIDSDIRVKYVILDANHMTIHDRIIARGEKEGCWCMQNIDACLEALKNDQQAVHIDTCAKSPEQIAEEIMGNTKISFIKPSLEYAKEISDYRQEFLDNGDHMDGCGPLRKYEDPEEYIEVCKQKSNPDTAEAVGGHAEQFLLVRESDNRLVGMAQYRFGVDPMFCIGYSVRPSERRKGYAKLALKDLLLWLKDQGQVSTPISCEPSNEASKKVILNYGGKLTDTCTYKGIDLMVFEIPIEMEEEQKWANAK